MSEPIINNTGERKSHIAVRILDALLVLAIVSIWLLLFFTSKENVSSNALIYKIGQTVGYSLWLGLGSYLVYRFILKRRRGSGLLTFLILLFLLSLTQLIAVKRAESRDQALLSSLAQILKATIEGQPIDTSAINNKELGELRPVIDFTLSYNHDIQMLSQEMFTELNGCYGDILTPSRLASASELQRSRIQIAKADSINHHYEKRLVDRIDSACRQARALEIDDNFRVNFVGGFDESTSRTKIKIDELFSIQDRYIRAMDDMMQFLLNRQGTYRLENGQLVFDTEANLLGYNQFVDQVNALSDEHEAWLKGAQSDLNQRLNEIQRK